MELQEIRGKLDELDPQIVRLFEERMRLCHEVAEYKIAAGKAVYDPEREKQKLETLQNLTDGAFNRQAVKELFLQIMTLSRRYQYQRMAGRMTQPDLGFQKIERLRTEGCRVAFQGLEGAYSHAAALSFFGPDAELYHVRLFEDLMIEVQEGRADYAVLPIENSSAGAVTDSYDLLMKYDNYIVAELFLPIRHFLLGREEADLAGIRRVFAHPQALMQSSEYLNGHRDWQQISLENNAVAAKKVRDDGDPAQAAVAGEEAAQVYGLKKLAGPINNSSGNTTRFLILSRQPVYQAGAGKISLCFELPHQSGTLYNMLGNFIFNNVNMTMIESRPIPERSWEYRFFVDIEGNLEQAGVQNALCGIRQEARNVKIFGNY